MLFRSETEMSWHYQIIKHKDWYGLHEVFLEGDEVSWTEEPISFVSSIDEGPNGVIRALRMALDDCERLPFLEESNGD